MRLSSRWLSPALLCSAAAGLAGATVPAAVPLVALLGGLMIGLAFRSPVAGLAAVAICVAAATAGTARLDGQGPGGLSAFVGPGQAITGRLDGSPRAGTHSASAVATLEGPATGKVLLRLPAAVAGDWMVAGAAFKASARLKKIAGRPGDFLRSMQRRGIHFTATVSDVAPAKVRRSALDEIRSRAADASAAGLSGDVAALARGITLGDDSAMSEGTAQAFKRSGLSHLTAVSGANVLLLVLLIHWMLGTVGTGVAPRFWATTAAVIAYAVICGGSASVVRAAAMGVCALVAGFAGRASSRAYALAFAAVVLLLLDPWAFLDPGAQLSFSAVVGIFLLAARLRDRLPVLPSPFGEALAVTLAATAATAPVIAWHFGEVSLTAIPANVLASLAVAPATWMGFIAAAIGQVWFGAATLVNAVAQFPLGFVLDLARIFAAPSWSAIECSAATAAAVILLPAIAFAYLPRAWLGRRAFLLVVIAAATAVVPIAATRAGDRVPHYSVTALDVGQGDAILLRGAPGCDVLVDTGPPGGRASKLLRRAGVRRLAALVITHAARDHHGGAAEIAHSFEVDLLIDGGGSSTDELLLKARAATARRGARQATLAAGLRAGCDGVELHAVWPPKPAAEIAISDANLTAGVFLATVGETLVLLTSDAESEVLTPLDLPQVDVLKVSHHGSADSGLPQLLKALRPRVAVISYGPNTYGHPNPQTTADLHAVTTVRATGKEGNVVISAVPPGT